MKYIQTLALACLVVLGLFGCWIDISQPTVPAPSSGTESSASPPASLDNGTPSPLATTVPVTWAGLNLTGRLVYISTSSDSGLVLRIQILDLALGEIRTVFTTSGSYWIYYASISPDGKQLVISYIPPSQAGSAPNRGLYTLSLDGASPPQP